MLNRVSSLLRKLKRLPRTAMVSLRAYVWARTQLRTTRERLKETGAATRVPPPMGLAPRGRRGLVLAMRNVEPTCLERALVIQAWMASYTVAPDVVIGVRKQDGEFGAHAWVDGIDDPWFDESFDELTRLRATPAEG